MRIAGLGILLALASCDSQWTESEEAGFRRLTAELTPGANRSLVLEVPVEPSDGAMSVSLSAADWSKGFFFSVADPDGEVPLKGEDWWQTGLQLTNGIYNQRQPTLVWPIREEEGKLSAGVWRLVGYAEEEEAKEWTADVFLRAGPAAAQQTLKVRAFVDDGIWADPDLSRGIEDALEYWQEELYGPVGITLEIEVEPMDLPREVPPPLDNETSDLYLDLTANVPADEAVLVLSSCVGSCFQQGFTVLGVAGGIPGPMISTRKSVVVASVLAIAGTDGVFSPPEVRIMAETFGHEMGHYLGLFHPIEVPCESYEDCTPESPEPIRLSDALEDTTACETYGECVTVLEGNLMFPTTICYDPFDVESCVSQDTITEDQRTVIGNNPRLR